MLIRAYPPSRQRGAILVMTALLIVVLVGIAALALDLGRVLTLRTEMQNAVDAAALAGAAELDGKDGAIYRAKAAAQFLLEHKGHHAEVAELLGNAMQTDNSMPPYDEFKGDGSYAGLKENTFVFFCAIGSKDDDEAACEGDKISSGFFAGKTLATGHTDAHYIWVHLRPDAEAGGSYEVPLYFLPVLSFITGSPKTFQEVAAVALAGRHFYMCNYPPLMICDPFEDGAAIAGVNNIREAVEHDPPYIEPGDMLILKYQGPSASWAPGLFAFLSPGVPGDYETGEPAVGEYLANPCKQGCTPAIVKPKPGAGGGSWPVRGLNTYFEVYDHGSYKPDDFPPAPNVGEYPPDESFQDWDASGRFGKGDWNRAAYATEFHSYFDAVAGTTVYDDGFSPSDLSGMTRWEVYNKEITNGYLPHNVNDIDGVDDDPVGVADLPRPADRACVVSKDSDECPSGTTPLYTDSWGCDSKGYKSPVPGAVDCNKLELPDLNNYPMHFFPDGRPNRENLKFSDAAVGVCDFEGASPTAISKPERRRFFVAVVQCNAQGAGGSGALVVDNFAKFFVLDRPIVTDDSVHNTHFNLVTEFLGLVDDRDEEYHVEVQLYE